MMLGQALYPHSLSGIALPVIPNLHAALTKAVTLIIFTICAHRRNRHYIIHTVV